MLRQILEAFENSPGPIHLEALSRQLDVECSVLAGMLAELVRMGRLVRIEDRTQSACTACGVKGRCPYLLTTSGAYYALPEMAADGAVC